MEYSKEDLMEAKKQILGVGENMGTEESKKIWEENAQFWAATTHRIETEMRNRGNETRPPGSLPTASCFTV